MSTFLHFGPIWPPRPPPLRGNCDKSGVPQVTKMLYKYKVNPLPKMLYKYREYMLYQYNVDLLCVCKACGK